jgi:hypothetical protein
MPLHPIGTTFENATQRRFEMNRYQANSAATKVTALIVSLLISASTLMAASSIRVADIAPAAQPVLTNQA